MANRRDTASAMPVRTVETWEAWLHPRRSWADGPPDATDERVVWRQPDGVWITDEDRIAGLEAQHKETRHGDA